MPLHRKLGSGLLNRDHMAHIAVNAAADEASTVLTTMRAAFASPTATALPALKPNQPKTRNSVPVMYIGTLWAGMGLGLPSGRNLPSRGPRKSVPARAATPPNMWTTEEPAKSTTP